VGILLDAKGSIVDLTQFLKKRAFAGKLKLPDLPPPSDPNYSLIKTVLNAYGERQTSDHRLRSGLERNEPWAIQKIQSLKEKITGYFAEIYQRRQGITENKAAMATLAQIRTTYDRVYESIKRRPFFDKNLAMIAWAAHNLAAMGGEIQSATDMDMTMTWSTAYLRYLPHAPQFENFLTQNGRDELAWVMARYASKFLPDPAYERIYYGLGQKLPLRSGVNDWFEHAQLNGIPVTIMSANFLPIVAGCLTQIPPRNRRTIRSVLGLTPESIAAADKELMTVETVLSDPRKLLTVNLDGETDKGCFEGLAHGIVGCAFVLKDSELARRMPEYRIPYFEFSSFYDILYTTQAIQTKAKEILGYGSQ
jgi:hypothetical protein